MNDLRLFIPVFVANLTSDDVFKRPRADLSVRVLNVIGVLRSEKIPEPPLRAALLELLATWNAVEVRKLLPRTDQFWFETQQHEALLKELLAEVAAMLRAA